MTAVRSLHTQERFSFIVRAPFDIAWPLFGAEGERAWAPGWDPTFIWPREAIDREGMVFTISHGLGVAIWVNTEFDPLLKRIRYVYVIPQIVVTVISLRLEALGETTRVSVTYERTALGAAANDQVRLLAEDDKTAGEEWSRQIDGYLRARG